MILLMAIQLLPFTCNFYSDYGYTWKARVLTIFGKYLIVVSFSGDRLYQGSCKCGAFCKQLRGDGIYKSPSNIMGLYNPTGVVPFSNIKIQTVGRYLIFY